jgi:hypothetical protein
MAYIPETENPQDFQTHRDKLIAEAERFLAKSPTASGGTILIPRQDGSVEEVFVRKPRGGGSGERT